MTEYKTGEPHKIADLNQLYTDAESSDQQIFAEMRSNFLLVSGDHYNRRQNQFYRRIRDSKELTNEQKIRLIKNHVQRIVKIYANNIVSSNPGVGFSPKEDGNMQQQKRAELHHALWRDAHEKNGIDDLVDDWSDEFIQSGEVIAKIFYDSSAGPITGYAQKVEEATGTPLFDEMGQPVLDESKPIHKGGFVFEGVLAPNLLRPSECKDMKKASWLGIRKMMDSKKLKEQFPDAVSKNIINPTSEETFIVFDGSLGGYKQSQNQVMVREYYFKPCGQYPRGYYFITTKDGILAEGELPGGIFPIVVQPMEKIPTTPRGRSIIKIMRPYQAEINRSASKIAEHQVTLGDDKLLIQNGTKLSAGIALPGVRALNFTGMIPQILPGRDGSQYLNYMLSQIKEMYDVMNIAEEMEKETGQLDAYTLLFRSAKAKKPFQRYVKRFESFLIQVVKTYLRLAKVHLSDEELINAFGRKEIVNIPEFRNSGDVDFEIKIEAQSEDIETKMGKQLVLNHILQYVGTQLKPEDIGKIMRAMPYSDSEAFDDLTLDFDMATNEILALDRGERPPIHESDNHAYLAKKLLSRMKKADFEYLPDQVKMNYVEKLKLHSQIDAFQKLQIQRAEQGFIPTGGYLVALDFYVPDPTDKTGVKTRRARLPYQAVEWLIKQLEAQGQGQQQLEGMDQSLQAQYADTMLAQGGASGPQGMLPTGSQNSGMGMASPSPGMHQPAKGATAPYGVY